MSGFNLPPGVSGFNDPTNPGPDLLERIEDSLFEAGKAFDSDSARLGAMSHVLTALGHMSRALIESADRINALEERLRANEQATNRAANVASCLANGITPD